MYFFTTVIVLVSYRTTNKLYSFYFLKEVCMCECAVFVPSLGIPCEATLRSWEKCDEKPDASLGEKNRFQLSIFDFIYLYTHLRTLRHSPKIITDP